MSKYDDASWHYGGDFPEGLPQKNGATHTGMFLNWCINNDLISEELKEDSAEEIEKVKRREITGAEFVMESRDGKFSESDLSDLGNSFEKIIMPTILILEINTAHLRMTMLIFLILKQKKMITNMKPSIILKTHTKTTI